MTRVARAAAIVALAGCAGGAAAPDAPGSLRAGGARREAPAPRRRDARVDRAMQEMSHVRELSVVRDVSGEVVSRDALMRELRAHVDREVPRAEIDAERTFLTALGVIAPDEDYERETYAAVRRAAGGMYLPEKQTMFLPDDLGGASLATSLAHEAVHALQDQHFGLEAFERYAPGAGDAMLARSCLAEGDATSATEEEPLPADDASYVERELAAPYAFGTAFVRALRARGGWAEVDRAWTRGDLTTEQVLHPDKWAGDEPALAVPEPTFRTLGSSFARTAADTHGELGLLLLLEAGVPAARAAQGASGWGGDRSVSASDGARTAIAWRVRWDDDASARRGFEIVRAAFANGRTCRDERSSPLAVTRDGRDALVLVGPKGSSCALLEAWSKEVFAGEALP